MNKPKSIFTLFFLANVTFLVAQDSIKSSALIFKTDILMPILWEIEGPEKVKYFSITGEYGFKKRFSTQLTTAFLNDTYTDNDLPNYFNNRKLNRIDIAPTFKVFFSKKKYYNGMYLGAFIKNSSINFEARNRNEETVQQFTSNYFGGGFLFGYQGYINKKIVYDFLISYGKLKETKQNLIVYNPIDFLYRPIPNGTDIAISLNVGYKF
ncbi:MAG: DUF3575 domain-containing protein [Bacteroidia bacterium]